MFMGDTQEGGLLHKFISLFELPRDVILDLPKATLLGDVQMVVENHKGLLEYTPARLRIRTSQGEVCVVGAHLRIGSLFREELVVEGRIDSVQFNRRG